MKKSILFVIIFSLLTYTATADDLADLLQDLAVQTACLGRYSTAHTGVYVTSRYDDPPDWYDPPMMANRFAVMSGNMTRIITFYGVCFDYAQFAWNDIKEYQKDYNEAGMKEQQWYIASTKPNDPYTIILYDPVSKEKATVISNGVYLRENSRHKVYAHDGAEGHAWIWVQHKNGTWYWIDPTWTDNTGYVWWGIVEDGEEVKCYPDPDLCVAYDYPKPYVANNYPSQSSTNTGTQSSNPTYPEKPKTEKPRSAPSNNNSGYYNHVYESFLGYNYLYGMPLGLRYGFYGFHASLNLAFKENTSLENISEGISEIELLGGYSFNLFKNRLYLLAGAGVNYSEKEYEVKTGSRGSTSSSGNNYVIETEGKTAIALEIGLLQIVFKYFYLSATYRLIDFSKSGFSLGVGIID